MEKEYKTPPCLTYGISHSRKYTPSVISPFLSERDKDGKLVKIHSDIYLLLRQKSLQKSIGVDVLRSYFDSIHMNGNQSLSTDQLSDDDLFNLIDPKDVNNLTTAYEWANYLNDRKDELKQKYDDYRAQLDKKSAFEKWLGKKESDSDKPKDE